MGKVSAEEIETLVEIFDSSNWDQLHVKFEGFEIYLSKDPASGAVVRQTGNGPETPGTTLSANPPPVRNEEPGLPSVAIPDGLVAVRAPHLGTFYRSPKPGAPPYVEIDQMVKADTEVCLIEVMKLFTSLRAGVAGLVRKVLVSDAQMVEFDQPLILIEPAT